MRTLFPCKQTGMWMFGGSPTSWEQSQSVSQTQRKYLVTGPTKASDPRGKTHRALTSTPLPQINPNAPLPSAYSQFPTSPNPVSQSSYFKMRGDPARVRPQTPRLPRPDPRGSEVCDSQAHYLCHKSKKKLFSFTNSNYLQQKKLHYKLKLLISTKTQSLDEGKLQS